ncbi:M48 family metallopeptidase [Insolitispirillum peregrinum]|uniref:YgjP-like metallopeptidase domain-containing protein n=1 Tax=Insolitispirillum peregrinum TaxID=80876 RepID=A0A1N7KD95_9PROT|nr:SprT family zinc-dependent metalloprotease [Insolitispirillum peregrinum]SIS59543.1 hypothetical protein SAMN05421779_102716 [Insolitispirillum peregrinum]
MPPPAAPPLMLELGNGRQIAIELKLSTTARRLSMRVDGLRDRVVVVHPPGISRRVALGFVQEKRAWVQTRLAALPPRIPFAAGAEIPLLGQPHRICPAPEARRGVWAEDGVLWVSGQPEHLPRRVRDYLIRRAEDEITPRAHRLASHLGRRLNRVSFRDVRSRWGSCNSHGDMTFSWRLVLAPEPVLSYVVAHEVAHLVELNHSPRFWALVEDLAGDYAADERWLKDHGSRLHRYG